MSATDLAAVIVAVVSLGAVVVLVVAAGALVRTMRELREAVDLLRTQTLPMVVDLRAAVSQAGTELERVEGILDTAERISDTVDSASRLTFRALSPPLIKTISIMAGARRAGRRLRGKGAATPIDASSSESIEAVATSHATRPRRRELGRRREAR
ncbi:MAG TPA: hypothetical protein VGQ20_10055 [Acidimicrobiales bacterium]|nr:hypothetical protein [Acidimicrobiales bacterium]